MKLITRPPCPALRLLAVSCAALATFGLAPAFAATASRHAAKASPDVVGDFRALAQQRPWDCPPAAGAGASPFAADGAASCAWQNRLRRQSWSWSDDAAPACISKQARWWHAAQAGLPAATPRSIWDARWTVQALQLSVGEEQRLLLLERDAKGRWQATEWRWNPNPRPATRRWQEGRWKLLVEALAQPRFKGAAAGASEAAPVVARMRPVFRKLPGARPGEMQADGMRLESAGLCLQASNPLPGQPKLHLSYSPNDSRLEQRAAMHLQLSRQHPNAKWLTQFKLLEMPASLPSGAKFIATWVEAGQVVGQLWMPEKDDASTVRVRIAVRLPQGQAQGQGEAPPAAAKIKPVIERELEAIARQWAVAYE